MSDSQKSKLIAYAICGVVATLGIMQAISVNVPSILAWDILGYYLYLPLSIIRNDIGLSDMAWLQSMFAQYKLPGTIYQVNALDNGNWAIRYSNGWAVMYLPFFLIGHIVATMGNYAVDGFSAPYQWAIFCGSLFYFATGALLLMHILLRWFSASVAIITFVAVFLGTNYLHVNTSSAGMPHVHLFTLYALLIVFTDKWHREEGGKRNSVLLGAVIGLIALTRPSDVICALVPLLWGVTDLRSLQQKAQGLLAKHKADLLVVVTPIFLLGMTQIAYWFVVTGKPIYQGYNNPAEGLDLLAPHTLNFLFSFRKGWFIYTPIMILAVIGFFIMRKQRSALLLPLAVFAVLYIYIVSSWTNWWYADSFSQRPMMHVYALLAIPLAFFVKWGMEERKWMLLPIPVLIALNLFQTWQTDQGILHTSRMTWPYYQQIFLKDYVPPGAEELLLVYRDYAGGRAFVDSTKYAPVRSFSKNFDAGTAEGGTTIENAPSGCCAFVFEETTEYGAALEMAYRELSAKDHAWIEISCVVLLDSTPDHHKLLMVSHMSHNDWVYGYAAIPIEETVRVGEWSRVSCFVLTPEMRTNRDPFKTYVWKQGKGRVLMDDLTITVHERKPVIL